MSDLPRHPCEELCPEKKDEACKDFRTCKPWLEWFRASWQAIRKRYGKTEEAGK